MDPVATRYSDTALAPGAQVGPFVLESFLGGGADTEVWRASGDGIVVALKLPRNRSDLFAVARLAHESLALDLVRHPNVVHRFDADSSGGDAWLATALHEAGTLAQLLDDGLLGVPEAAAALAPIAESLANAHAIGVVHRDVNPSNILLTVDGPTLIDFGHAAIAGQTWDGFTSTGAPAIARTAGFTPGDTAIAPSIDVFGLGITLLEAVTGVRSVDELTSERQRTVAAPILELTTACCAESSEDRPSSDAVAVALHSLAVGASAPIREAPTVIDLVRAESLATISTAGRSGELGRLSHFRDTCSAANELGSILVVAPAGVGKSWLIETALGMARRGGFRSRTTRCTDVHNDIRVLWRVIEGDIQDPRLRPATAAVLKNALGNARDSRNPHEFALGDVADAFAECLALQPTVVFIDDLHLANGDLLDLIGLLSFRPGTAGALFLAARPGFIDTDDLGAETFALGSLDDDSVRACVIDICGKAHAESAVALANGNPLFALEVAHALRAGLSLDNAQDLTDVIRDRLAAASPTVSKAIALASVCGHDFWPEALGTDFASAVPQLVRAGYARPKLRSTLGATTEFEWSHPMLREVAYSQIADQRRSLLHAQIARTFDARNDIAAEYVARHASAAYSLGELSVTQILARQAAVAVGDALDSHAVARADKWVAAIRSTGLDVAHTDVLDAEVKARCGEFADALDLVAQHLDRADLIGAKALAVGALSLVGVGDYETAVGLGTRARDLFADRPIDRALNSRALATALRERGCLVEALAELDAASADARHAGQPLLATRIDVEAINVLTMLAHTVGDSSKVVERARSVLQEMQSLGDRNGLIDLAASALVDSIAVEDPVTAHAIQLEAFQISLESADLATVARVARRLVEVSWDAERPDTMLHALEYIGAPGLSVHEQAYFALITDLSRTAVAQPDHALGDRLALHVRGIDAIADASFSDQHMALCAYAYAGRLSDMQRTIAEFHKQRPLPLLFEVLNFLHIALLGGPPFATPDGLAIPETTAFNNELAMLKYLIGDRDAGDLLMRDRHAYLVSTGNTHQGYGPTFCGALFSALGPADCDPPVAWAKRQLIEPLFPAIWTFQRALVALILSERGGPDAELYRIAANDLRAELEIDAEVKAWFDPRITHLH